MVKFSYVPPLLLPFMCDALLKNYHAAGILALNLSNDIVYVRELDQYSIWKGFWENVASVSNPEHLFVEKKPGEDSNAVTDVAQRLIEAFNYIMVKGYIFLGVLYLDANVLDSNILTDGVLWKKKMSSFMDMHTNYRQKENFPTVINHEYVETLFLGQGERFFDLNHLTFLQMAKMTEYFKGSFFGIVGEANDELNFTILSQNVTDQPTIDKPKVDRNGRETLLHLESQNMFHPAAGFRLDFGLWSLKSLKQWEALELISNFQEAYKLLLRHQIALIKGEESPVEPQNPVSVFDLEFITKLRGDTGPSMMSAQQLMARPTPVEVGLESESEETSEVQSESEVETTSESEEPENEAPPQIAKPTLQKPMIPPPSAAKTPLAPIKLEKIAPVISRKLTKVEDLAESSGEFAYEDAFNTSAPSVSASKEEAIEFNDGSNVINADAVNDNFLKQTESMLDVQFGRQIDINSMSQEDIFRDLKASLDAMSKLDELAEKDAAVSRIYYPPPTLISFANNEGMEIGGSTCVVSMGAGRNLWMVPELRRMQMWGKFYKDLEGNPQIEDFVAMDEKDIESIDQLENMLQTTFISIRKNNNTFLGLVEIEGNGFESRIFEECPLESGDLNKLMQIHVDRRLSAEFPKLTEENFINIKFYGQHREFIENPQISGILDIAQEITDNPIYAKGFLTGVVCVGSEAAYFFILTDNFDQLNAESPTFTIDNASLQKMYELIESEHLTPVSWFKLRFGFNAFQLLPLWEELIASPILDVIKSNYQKYIQSLLKTKQTEDAIRQKATKKFNAPK